MDYSLSLETVDELSFYISRPLLDRHRILAVFTMRQGGTSLEPYSSLNLAFHVGDDTKTVIRNREAVCQLFGIDPTRITCAEQVHRAEVAIVTDPDTGAGALSFEDSIKGVDALISDRRFAPLMLFFADCIPIILVDPQKRVVGVVHAGWRGIRAEIIKNAIEMITRSWLVVPDRIIAFIGPSIGACCYQVSNDLIRKFSDQFKGNRDWLYGDRVDLRALGRSQLVKSGIQVDNIYLCNDCCTSCQSEIFFSYRAEAGKTGRQAALVAII
ncbi:MAG: peptidoglycan editing factor PgeF [Actinobacteria bacterium]|nr:peptidoglycan editing factor PgeF [Actinomycetota bacterium]